ncbi:MAG: hypothetical protein PHP50_13795 [Lachnospiraceae bacterium]|nr:hypothetical protein [Lachnospiraceae bacterium]
MKGITMEKNNSILIHMNETTSFPAELIDWVKGKNISIEFQMGQNVSWILQGKDILETGNTDLDMKAEVHWEELQLTFTEKPDQNYHVVKFIMKHKGKLGLIAGLRFVVGETYTGACANLFYCNEIQGTYEYMGTEAVDENGTVEFPIAFGATYLVVMNAVPITQDILSIC